MIIQKMIFQETYRTGGSVKKKEKYKVQEPDKILLRALFHIELLYSKPTSQNIIELMRNII